VLAPLLDLREGPRIAATLAARRALPPGSPEDEVHTALEARDVVRIEIHITPRPVGYAPRRVSAMRRPRASRFWSAHTSV
jgi:hypothetical protein